MTGSALVEKVKDIGNPWNKGLVEVQTLAEQDDAIIRLGFVSGDDLVRLYNTATVCVMPSLYEGFGLPVLEAMSSGCPVIATKEGSLPEIGGENVYYVDAREEESIAEGIRKVFNDTPLRQALSLRGRKAAENFTWKKTARETARVYKALVAHD